MSLIRPLDMNYVSKPWGWELWIWNGDLYCGKKLFIKQGRHCSYHHHRIKDEVLYIESGKIAMNHDVDGGVGQIVMPAGYAFHVPTGLNHQMHALEDTVIIEFSTHHEDADSYRKNRDLLIPGDDHVQGW